MKKSQLIKKLNEAIYDDGNGNGNNISKKLEYSIYKGKDGKLYLSFKGLESTDKHSLKSFKAVLPPSGNPYYWASIEKPEALFSSPSFIKGYNYLISRGYELPDIKILEIEVNNLKNDSFTSQEVSEQNKKTASLFQTILTNITSPKMQELLQKIGRIGFDFNEKVLGHILHPNNALKAYAIKPDATFVAQRITWRGYNRIIKPNAVKILLTLSSQKKDYGKAEKELGVTRADASKNQHLKNALYVAASEGESTFHSAVYYDVSDTMVIPGYEDKFTGEAGYVDNLKGVFNDLANEKLGKNKVNSEELGLSVDETRNEMFSKAFLGFIKDDKDIPIDIINRLAGLNPKSEATVVEMLKKYYYNVAYAREHDSDLRNCKTYSSVIVTLISNNVAESETVKLLGMYENYMKKTLYNEKDFAVIAGQTTKVNYGLQKHGKISENIMNEAKAISPEDVMRMININPEDIQQNTEPTMEEGVAYEEIKEMKDKFFNTLNKLYKTK